MKTAMARRMIISVTVILMLTMMMTACADPAKQIVGTWMTSTSALGFSVESTYTFDDNGTGKMSVSGVSVDMTYTISGNHITINTTVLGVSSETTYTFTIKDNTLTLDAGGETVTYTKK